MDGSPSPHVEGFEKETLREVTVVSAEVCIDHELSKENVENEDVDIEPENHLDVIKER
jgi:hypothetical protein